MDVKFKFGFLLALLPLLLAFKDIKDFLELFEIDLIFRVVSYFELFIFFSVVVVITVWLYAISSIPTEVRTFQQLRFLEKFELLADISYFFSIVGFPALLICLILLRVLFRRISSFPSSYVYVFLAFLIIVGSILTTVKMRKQRFERLKSRYERVKEDLEKNAETDRKNKFYYGLIHDLFNLVRLELEYRLSRHDLSGYSSNFLFDFAAERGLIDVPEFNLIHELKYIRNRVAHGDEKILNQKNINRLDVQVKALLEKLRKFKIV